MENAKPILMVLEEMEQELAEELVKQVVTSVVPQESVKRHANELL